MQCDQSEQVAHGRTSRRDIRERKRVIRIGARSSATEQERMHARESAIALLEHSIRLGHQRLTLQRLANAVQIGAPIKSNHWEHCEAIAQELDPAVREKIIGRLVETISC